MPEAATLDDLLQPFSPEVRHLTRETRDTILNLYPNAHQTINLGWKTIILGSGPGMKDAAIAINPLKTRVNVNFYNGIDLADPKGLLEGTGKSMRHVKVKSEAVLKLGAFKALVKDCVKAAKVRSKPTARR